MNQTTERKSIDLASGALREQPQRRREPIINWRNIPMFLGFIASLALAKIAFLWAMGRLAL